MCRSTRQHESPISRLLSIFDGKFSFIICMKNSEKPMNFLPKKVAIHDVFRCECVWVCVFHPRAFTFNFISIFLFTAFQQRPRTKTQSSFLIHAIDSGYQLFPVHADNTVKRWTLVPDAFYNEQKAFYVMGKHAIKHRKSCNETQVEKMRRQRQVTKLCLSEFGEGGNWIKPVELKLVDLVQKNDWLSSEIL